MYDLCIVGAGLVGSAAARHATLVNNVKICIIGPKEPEERKVSTGREVFGAHYDEGRITRMSDPDPVWASLAQESINRYKDLEKKSGVQFYEEVGCLMTGHRSSEFMSNVQNTVSKQNIESQYFDCKDIKKRFPFFNFSDEDIAVYEYQNAGHISPRRLIDAQLTVARKNGCQIYDDVVVGVRRVTAVSGNYEMEVKTESGRTYLAKKVLLTTGALTLFNNLLGTDCVPDLQICPLTIAKVEISSQHAAKLIEKGMPSVLYFGFGAKDWWTDFPRTEGMYGLYFLPPVRYPDGKHYLKLGAFHDAVPDRLSSLTDVQKWFCQSGNSKLATDTAHLMESFVKGVKMLSFHGDYCVIQQTATDRPYIDKVHSQLGVSIGGNGYAAKSSDEIGRISAMLMLKDHWESNIPRDVFKLLMKPKQHFHPKL